ncbi:MAG: FGGY family carbohydrate kinase [Bacteroidales bacterium]
MSQLEVLEQAVDLAGINSNDIAVGITNQRETTVIWDRRTGKPVYNAIVWRDRRTSGFCDALRAKVVI